MIDRRRVFVTIAPIYPVPWPERTVLLGRAYSVRDRVRRVIAGTVAAVVPAAAWYALAAAGVAPWPRASGPLGVGLGVLGGGIVAFEMALAPRKWLRGRRLGAVKAWLRWHIALGFLALPIIVVHSGFAWGGALSTATMGLFVAVFVSGVYGLILQQWLPKKILDEVPWEAVAYQIEFAVAKHVEEAGRLVGLINDPDEQLKSFHKDTLVPYLRGKKGAAGVLGSAADAARHFDRLRDTLPAEAGPAVAGLEDLATLRRKWDRDHEWNNTLNWWLHSWLAVHLPLSVLMSGLMVVHAVKAMKWV